MFEFSFVCFALISFAYIPNSAPITTTSVEVHDKMNILLQSYQVGGRLAV